MVVLGVKTNEPEAEIWLAEDGVIRAQKQWHAHRSLGTDLLPTIDELLKRNNKDFSQIQRLAVCVGPGSFTGLRIGIACVNALAYSYSIPIVELSSAAWSQAAGHSFTAIESKLTNLAKPVYGSPPHTTTQKK